MKDLIRSILIEDGINEMAKTRWTTDIKPSVIATLNKANIEGEARKTIIAYEKAINTARNKFYSSISITMFWEGGHADKASKLLELLNGNGQLLISGDKPKFWDEWVAYNKALGNHSPSFDIGDALA